jgi:hypothetical protein
VDEPGDDLLADPALASDQDFRVRTCGGLDILAQPLQGAALTDERDRLEFVRQKDL